MPLFLPNLDDRTFADLIAQMRSLIPHYTKRWTNHNPSDPGITILELLSWLTEMVLFRLDKIPERSYLTFLDLIGVKPSCAHAEITFEIRLSKDALPDDFIIRRGARIAAIKELTGEEIIFETLAPIFKEDGRWEDENRPTGIFKTQALNTVPIENEVLGKSDGSPNQVFPFAQRPVFLDKGDEAYEGNPQIFVNGQKWNYRKDLLESAKPDPENPSPSQHYTVEQLPGLVRFGDDVHGKIPPKNAEVVCTYRRLGGARGNVDSGKIIHLKDHIEGVDDSKVEVNNEYPASGGVESESLEDLLIRGLERIQERYRAVSDEDFENLAKEAAPGEIARIKVVTDKNLEGTTSTGEGHVSLIVLPACEYIGLHGEPQERFPRLKEAILNPGVKKLQQDIIGYLEPRRLITTVVHAVRPQFTEVNLKIRVREKPGIDLNTLIEKIKRKIACFLDPYAGGENGCGWPFGRHVHRSELYQQIEGLEGVDYIEEMLMNNDPMTSFITVEENDLVCLKSLHINDEELLIGEGIEQA
jgi:hypothetical protein